MNIVAVNAGSTSLKLERYALEFPTADVANPMVATSSIAVSLDRANEALAAVFDEPVDAVAHRIVRVPENAAATFRLDEASLSAIRSVEGDAPLHDASALGVAGIVARMLPNVPQFGVSDSAFHRTMPDAARTYAIPQSLTSAGLHRIGYHGLNHEYAAHRGCALRGLNVRKARIVTAHLGGGSSLCAIRNGESIDTTMGFTPLEGLPMGTRSGSVDPGLLIHLLRGGMHVDALEDLLEHRSGLLGISGMSDDVRELLAARERPHARLALDVLAWRLRASLGAMVAVLGGVDLIVFTGGIGEHAVEVRSSALAGGLGVGITLDERRNARISEGAIDGADSAAPVCVVPAREGWQLARAARAAMHDLTRTF